MKQQQIKDWISQDVMRMQALNAAQQLGLNDWCLAAGFVRNLVWDRLHNYRHSTPLNDIDVIYFNPQQPGADLDREYEQRLCDLLPLPWSVKNQARMHLKHQHSPYTSSSEAISYWVETETAIGVRLNQYQQLELIAPLGVDALFDFTITLNPKCGKPEMLLARAAEKKWTEIWQDLHIKM